MVLCISTDVLPYVHAVFLSIMGWRSLQLRGRYVGLGSLASHQSIKLILGWVDI